MLTNTASDQGSQVFKRTDVCPYPAALIADDGAQSVASPRMGWCSHEPDVQPIRSSIRSLVLCADAQRVSDQPASLREPYTAISAAITATDRLIADGMQRGYLHAASSLTGITGGGFDSPSTQRPNLAGRHGPRRCVLGLTVASQTQRDREGGVGKCSRHAALRGRRSSLTASRENTQRPRVALPIRIAGMPATAPSRIAYRRTVDSLTPRISANSVALTVFTLRTGRRVMLAPAFGHCAESPEYCVM